MIYKLWTLKQMSMLKKISIESRIPEGVIAAIEHNLQILDDNYGEYRKNCDDDRGYVCLLIEEDLLVIEKTLKMYNMLVELAEYEDYIQGTDDNRWCIKLYLISDDYGIIFVYKEG